MADGAGIALAGVIVAGAVGSASAAVTALNLILGHHRAKADREHARQLAHDARVFAGRSRAYEEALRHLHRRWFFIQRTHPVAGPTRDPPPLPTDDELLAVEAVLGAFGSDPVRRAVYDFGTLAAEFKFAASQLDAVLEQERAGPTYEMCWNRVDGFRNRAREKLREIEAMIQNELMRLDSR